MLSTDSQFFGSEVVEPSGYLHSLFSVSIVMRMGQAAGSAGLPSVRVQSHAGPADSSTGPPVHSGIGVSGDPRGSTSHMGPTHAPGSRLRELPWVPPQGTCAIIRGGSSRLPRIPRDPLSGHMTIHLKIRPGKSRISGRSNHHTLPRFICLVWVTLSQW